MVKHPVSALACTAPMLAASALLAATGSAAAQPATAPPPVAPTLPVTSTTGAVPAAPPPAIAAPLPAPTAAQARQLRQWLADSDAEGLSRAPATDVADLDGEALVRAALDRARALHSGRLANNDFLTIWAMRPTAYDPTPGLADAVVRDRIGAWIAGLTPPYTGYDQLRRALADYRTIAARGGWKPIAAAGGDVGPQAPVARISALRTRLAIEDRDTPVTGRDWDAALRDAVVRAQKRYGLPPTGVAGAATLGALNVPVGDRIGSIVANMERWRWLPRTLPTHRIQVNIAAAVLTVFEGDKPVQSMRAVTGRVGDETPMLESRIHSIVINPPWNVPTGIATREYWPKEKAQPGYLAARGFKIIGTPETGQRLQQAAGPTSALGRLKFDFDNPFAVYLHDTPSRAKFASFDRLASHGCVRLERPRELAERVLQPLPQWTGEAIQAAIDDGKTQRVQLPEQVAVYLLYWTAYGSSGGAVGFRDDPYGWDKLLAGKIDARSHGQSLANLADPSKLATVSP